MQRKLVFFILFVVGLCLLAIPMIAQQRYWISFKDKNEATCSLCVSQRTLDNRAMLGLELYQWTDIPLTPTYLQALTERGIQPLFQSKWLNATSAYLSPEQVAELHSLPFVASVTPIRTRFVPTKIYRKNSLTYTTALQQVQAEKLQKANLAAKAIPIGIVDVGFEGADKENRLKHIFRDKRLKQTRDFLLPNNNRFFSAETPEDNHGRDVWTLVAGYNEDDKTYYGMATQAEFYLARTDHGIRETRTEEDNWIAAIEWLDSLGVRLVNTSLGYTDGFDDKTENYTPADMNGKTSKISQFAQIAADKKGMILVVAAGNEGDSHHWQVVSTPGDCEGVISVGATKHNERTKVSYSSIGPDFLDYLKPNIACFSFNGTSFSAPIITGLIGCLLEKNPALKPKQVRNIVEKAGHLYPYGNNYLGYGVPQAGFALELVEDIEKDKHNHLYFRATGNWFVLSAYYLEQTFKEKVIKDKDWVIYFHKRNKWSVIKQGKVKVDDGRVLVKREKNAQYTTLEANGKVIELIWLE